ncbi:MAG: albusnodin family lasso peptide [Pseudonocardiaceae bacterium]
MQEQITPRHDEKAAASEVRMRLGEATELTQGSGAGTSEDKRYLYN